MFEGAGQTRTFTGHVRLCPVAIGDAETGRTRTHPLRGVRMSGPPMLVIEKLSRMTMVLALAPVTGIWVPLGNVRCGGRGASAYHPVEKNLIWKNPLRVIPVRGTEP